MTTPEVPGISHHPFSQFPICTSNCKLYVPRINLVKISYSQVNSLIIFITFYLENFNANVPIMKMWDIATSNQGGRGLASFVGTIITMFRRSSLVSIVDILLFIQLTCVS